MMMMKSCVLFETDKICYKRLIISLIKTLVYKLFIHYQLKRQRKIPRDKFVQEKMFGYLILINS